MHAPFARHLTRFSRLPPAGASAEPFIVASASDPVEPAPTVSAADHHAGLAEARDVVRAELAATHEAERERTAAAHASELAEAVAAAGARRDAEEGASIAAAIEAAVADLRGTLAKQLARTLRPLLAEAVAARALAAMVETIERVLADPDHPVLVVRGPAARLAALEAALGRPGVGYEPDDIDDIRVVAPGIRIEARLEAALATLAATQEV